MIYVGSKTGKDGIHGASMASAEFTEESKQKRPNVQVGDPFLEKLLLEACLEAMQTGAIVGIQDMGAAGLTCSTCEMGSRGDTGIEIDLKLVPQRETGMTPYEIMLSESQERMLLVADKGREEEVFQVFRKWGLDAVTIGQVTDDGMMRVRDHGEVVAEIPAKPLADEAPLYDRPHVEPLAHGADGGAGASPARDLAGGPGDPARFRRRLLQALDLGAVRLHGAHQHRAGSGRRRGRDPHQGNRRPRWPWRSTATAGTARCRPREGARLAVAECCRNLSTVGALPVAATNCLNFGNPERPEIMAQLVEAIEGMGEACRFFETPITGGNVSLYNETLGEPIDPTPGAGHRRPDADRRAADHRLQARRARR